MTCKNISKKLCFLFLGLLFLSACSSLTNPSKDVALSETPGDPAIETQAPTVPIATPTETPTKTSEPTPTATTPPPQPVPLTKDNIQDIKMVSVNDFFDWGTLIDAEWSPDGETIIVTTNTDLQIVDAGSLEVLQSIGGFKFVHFLQDGNLLILDDRNRPGIIDMQSYEVDIIYADFPTNNGEIATNAYAISFDGKTIADASVSNTIKLIDIESGDTTEFDYYLGDHPKVAPQAVTFSPDGNFLFVSTPLSFQINETLQFDLGKQQVIAEEPNISGLPVFAPDGKRLAYRKNVFVSLYTSLLAPWSDHSAVFRSELSEEESVYYTSTGYAFIKDSSQIGILYQGNVYNYTKDDLRNIGTIIIYNTQDGTVDRFINDIPATSFDLGFSPDGSRFFTLSDEGIQIWQASDGELLLTSLPYHPDSPIAISPDGSLYAYIKENSVLVKQITNRETLIEFADLNLYMDSYVTFMGNDAIAISSYDHIDTYDIATGEWIKNYPELSNCDYNKSGNIMICAGMDLKIYDAQTGASLLNIRPSNDQYRYTVSDDGAYTVFCNENSGSIFLWDTWEGEQITSLKMSSEPACSWLDFSADSQYLASSLGAVWQIPDGELLMEIPLRGTSQVPAMDFSPNNELLLIYPQIYDLETGERLLQVSFIGGYNKAAWFLPDGITLVSRTDNTIQFWQVRE